MSGWIAMYRSEETGMLQERHPAAFLLLCQIAQRARWRREPCAITGLGYAQAMIGDWKRAGLKSGKSYRHAMGVLQRAGLVAFRGANKGTIATLLDTRIFRIEVEETGEQGGEPTDEPRGAVKGERRGEPGATKKTDRRKTLDKIDDLPLPIGLQTERFGDAWDRWKRHRAEIRKPLTPTAAESQLAEFAGWGEPRAVAAILHTVAKGWQGIREPEQAAGNASTFTPAFPGHKPAKP